MLTLLFCAGSFAPQTGVLDLRSAYAQQPGLLDINTATPQQLQALPGMGAAYVRRIVAGRPYTAKNQLVTRGILPASAYEQIKDRIVAHRNHPVAPAF